MTKREICERLINIHNRLFHEYAMADGMEDIDVEEIGKDISSLLLDIAVPEEEKEPPVLLYEERDEKVPCPVCGEPAAPIKNKPGEVYCKLCGRCTKRRPNR